MVPHLVARDRQDLVRNLVELTGQRHAKHGNTIFHLEPNLKDAPAACATFTFAAGWPALRSWKKTRSGRRRSSFGRSGTAPRPQRAFGFLADARCFLHYHYGRDDNQLSYDAQAQAAARGVGVKPAEGLAPADWMRIYFRQARVIDQLTAQLIDESAPARSGPLRPLSGLAIALVERRFFRRPRPHLCPPPHRLCR